MRMMPVLINMAIPFNQHDQESGSTRVNPTQRIIHYQKFIKGLQLIVGLLSFCLFYFDSKDSGEKLLFVLFGMGITFPILFLLGLVHHDRIAIYVNFFASFLMLISGVLSIVSWIYSEYVLKDFFKGFFHKTDNTKENTILKLVAGILLIINAIVYFIESIYLTLVY